VIPGELDDAPDELRACGGELGERQHRQVEDAVPSVALRLRRRQQEEH